MVLLHDGHEEHLWRHWPGFEVIAAQVRLDKIRFDARAQIVLGENADEHTASAVVEAFRLNRQQQAHGRVESP